MTKKNRIAVWSLRILVIAIAAAAIQFVLLNWSSWKLLLDDTMQKNKAFSLQDFELVNWMEKDRETISLQDPMLIHKDINMLIEQIQINFESDPLPPYVQVYYTSSNHKSFYEEAVVKMQGANPTITVEINEKVKDLRIDLGDDPGIVLQSLTVTINPVEFHFSIAIEVAVIMIVLGGALLFSLQREPDYGLSDKLDEHRNV